MTDGSDRKRLRRWGGIEEGRQTVGNREGKSKTENKMGKFYCEMRWRVERVNKILKDVALTS